MIQFDIRIEETDEKLMVSVLPDRALNVTNRESDAYWDFDVCIRRALAEIQSKASENSTLIHGADAVREMIVRRRSSEQTTKCDGNHGGPPCLDPECWQK